jgi:hypothetical protein
MHRKQKHVVGDRRQKAFRLAVLKTPKQKPMAKADVAATMPPLKQGLLLPRAAKLTATCSKIVALPR